MKKKLLFAATLVAAALTTSTQAQNWNQIGTDIDGESPGNWSGYSVSMPDNNTVAIGALFNSGSGAQAGHVRVYSRSGNVWLQKGADIDGEAASDRSGRSVSMPDSNTVAIGSRDNGGNGTQAGHVRVYAWNGSAWVQKGTDIDGEAAGDYSGNSVSMPDSNTVAIGAYWNDGNGSEAGHVRIYTWNGSSWTQKGVDIDGELSINWSGYSVSMPDNNTVAIGAPYNFGSHNASGHVRIYTWNGSSWVQKGADIDGEAASDQSGWSVSMPDSNMVAIGAHFNDGGGNNAGHVRIYRWDGTAWVQRGADIDGEAAADESGYSVSMPDSNLVAIGAIYNDGKGSDAGHVRIYAWNGSAWVQKDTDINGEVAGDQSGWSVSMSDSNRVAVGAYRNDGKGSDAGHVRVYLFCTNTASSTAPTACNSYTSPSGNYTWTTSGMYKDTIPNTEGCDSVITINLTVNNSTSGSVMFTACNSYTSPSGNHTWTTTGIYYDTIPNTAGCDSIITVFLIVNTVDVSVANTSPVLTANAIGATYQWLDCNNALAVISGATGQSYTATANGNYAVRVTQNSCTDTSTCEAVVNVLVLENNFESNIVLYPNPTKGQLQIDLGKVYNDVVVVVKNVAGQEVAKEAFTKATSKLHLTMPAEAGIYFVELTAEDRRAVVKVVKE